MKNDPIVDEIHQTRQRLAAKFDFNVSAIFADMRTRETQAGHRLKNRQSSPNKTMHTSGGSTASGMENSSSAAG